MPDEWERLPCGCQMGTTTAADGSGVFLFEPCSTDCPYYLFVLDENRKQGKPVTVIDAR